MCAYTSNLSGYWDYFTDVTVFLCLIRQSIFSEDCLKMAKLVPSVDLNTSHVPSFTSHNHPRITISHFSLRKLRHREVKPNHAFWSRLKPQQLELLVLWQWQTDHSHCCLVWRKLSHLSPWNQGFCQPPTLGQICWSTVCHLVSQHEPPSRKGHFSSKTLQT